MDIPQMDDEAMEAEEYLESNDKEKYQARKLKIQERRLKREMSKMMQVLTEQIHNNSIIELFY